MVNPGDAFQQGEDWVVRELKELRRLIEQNASARSLESSSIGAGGLTIKNGGSITVEPGGNITLAAGTFSASVVNGTTSVNGATVSSSTNFTAPNGTLVSAYARSHSVVTSYVAAYIDGSGNFLSTPSSLRMKRDIRTATWTREQRDKIRVVFYRLRAAYILADMQDEDLSKVETLAGVIGEELLAAGLPEFVVLDDRGRVFTVRYELLALIAIDGLQQVEVQMDELREEIAHLRAAIKP